MNQIPREAMERNKMTDIEDAMEMEKMMGDVLHLGDEASKKRIVRFGTGPLEHPDVKERMDEAQRTKKYLIAVWSWDDGKMNYGCASNQFPVGDLPMCEKQIVDSIYDFKMHAIGGSDNVVRMGKKTAEEMAERDSKVVSEKRKHDGT